MIGRPMADEAKKYFTVAEAERLIPRLERLMGWVMQCYAAVAKTRAALAAGQRQIMLSGGARISPEFWRAHKARLAGLTGELEEKLGEIVALGGVPKDLGLGLVDFLAVLDEREVNLCWRMGEQRIRFWHGLDEGYAARKPLPDQT
jgi:hypothetical protein